MARVNGVITLSEWERAEQLEEAIYEFRDTKLAEELLDKYYETKDEAYYKEFMEAENDYLRERGFLPAKV